MKKQTFDVAIIRFDNKVNDFVLESRVLEDNSYESLQKLMDEIDIEWFDYSKIGELNIIVDDEGLLKKYRINDPVTAMNGSPLYGNAILCRNKGAEFTSLDTEDFLTLIDFFTDYINGSQNGDESVKRYFKRFGINRKEYIERLMSTIDIL